MAVYKIGFKLDDSGILPATLKAREARVENIKTHEFFKTFGGHKVQIVSAELISEDDDTGELASQCHSEFVTVYQLGCLGMNHFDVRRDQELDDEFFRAGFGLMALIKTSMEKVWSLLQALETANSKRT
jgi:hypothetical protein